MFRETAISMDISPNLIEINFDNDNEFLFVRDKIRRIDITSSKDALNGYQKGQCFYCSKEIEIQTGLQNSCDVDHFFPHMLKNFNFRGVNQVWNLVLSCKTCNRGEGGKVDKFQIAAFRITKQEKQFPMLKVIIHYEKSIINQTGNTDAERRQFLQKAFNNAVEILPSKQKWKSPSEQHGVIF